MGAYQSTHVGIYLEVPYFKSEKETKSYKHPVTGNKMKSKFCPNTGAEGLEKINTHVEYLRPNSFIEKDGFIEDMFFAPEYSGGGKRVQTFILQNDKFTISEGEDDNIFNCDISNVNIAKLIAEFEIEYKKYLDYYKEEYGEISVCFGVVSYAH